MTFKTHLFAYIGSTLCLATATSVAAQSGKAVEVLKALQAKQTDKAAQLSIDYCEAGDMEICHLSGVIHSDPQFGISDHKFSRIQFDTACDGGYMPSCIPLAQMQYTGMGGAIDKMAAFNTAGKACKAGDAQACAAADKIKPEVTTTITLQGSGEQASVPVDMSEILPILDQMSAKLKETCSTSKITSADGAKKVVNECTAFTSQFSKAAFDADDALPDDEKAILNFTAAWAITAKVQMFLNLYAMNRLPADPTAVQCSAYDTAEFFMDESQMLSDTELSLRYKSVKSQIATGQAICSGI